jgi:3-oxoacyl-[acyl-carrier protein] reductase
MLVACITDAMSAVPKELLPYLASQATAEKRLGQPDDVAQVCVFLAQEGSRWVNGNTISVSGGMDML